MREDEILGKWPKTGGGLHVIMQATITFSLKLAANTPKASHQQPQLLQSDCSDVGSHKTLWRDSVHSTHGPASLPPLTLTSLLLVQIDAGKVVTTALQTMLAHVKHTWSVKFNPHCAFTLIVFTSGQKNPAVSTISILCTLLSVIQLLQRQHRRQWLAFYGKFSLLDWGALIVSMVLQKESLQHPQKR